jgi:predicted CXXCH cytochrome family protein
MNSCTECHHATTASLSTGSHAAHLKTSTSGGAQCADCHVAATLVTHTDGTVDLASALSASYTLGKLVVGDTLVGTCGTNACHNDGTGAAPVSAYTWSSAVGGANSCTECHSATTASLSTGSHASHFDGSFGPGIAQCGLCHTAATVAAHLNGTASMVTAWSSSAPTSLDGSAICNNCHGIVGYDTETIKAEWSDAAANTYAPASGNPDVTCESCHGGGDQAAWQNADGTGARAPSKTGSYTSTGHGLASGTYSPSGNPAADAQCVDCHAAATAAAHVGTGTIDRLQVTGNGLCAGCHDGAGGGSGTTQVSTHGNRSTTMGSATPSYEAQRASFELNCVECHDVHGTANSYMIGTVNADGPLVATRYYNGLPDTTTLLYSGTVSFTDPSVGAGAGGFASTASGATDRICNTCHTGTGGTYQHDAATTGHGTSACTGCHTHDLDGNFASDSQDGFMPKGTCESCHDGTYEYSPGEYAPNVMTYWTGTDGSMQDGGHGDPEGRGAGKTPVACADCHDISDPSGTHLDDTYNSIWVSTNRNANTAHLKPAFFSRTPPPVLRVGSGDWDVQVAFDNYCAYKCHRDTANWVSTAVPDMRHEKDTFGANGTAGGVDASGNYTTEDDSSNHWSVEFGTHLTVADGDSLNGKSYPVDTDLNSTTPATSKYATCVSCHDPHGTGTVEPNRLENRMVRDPWITAPGELCNACHN